MRRAAFDEQLASEPQEMTASKRFNAMVVALIAAAAMQIARLGERMDPIRGSTVMTKARFLRDNAANIDISKGLALAFAIVTAVISIIVAVAFAPLYLTNLAGLRNVFNETTTGDATVDPLLPTLGFILLIAGVLGFVGLLIGIVVVSFKQSKE